MKPFIFSLFSIFILICTIATANNHYPIIKNEGQWGPNFTYKISNSNFSLFLSNSNKWTYVFHDQEKLNDLHDNHETIDKNTLLDYFAYQVSFINGDLSKGKTRIKSDFYSNFFIGNDKSKWKSKIYSYKEIYYSEVWDKIDIKLYQTENGQLKYDFIIKPGGNIGDIQLKYEGTDCIKVENGKLNLGLAFNEIIEDIPVVYSVPSDNFRQQRKIVGSFVLNNGIVSVDIPNFNSKDTIIIDPTLIYATASGSSGNNWGFAATFDNLGNGFGAADVFSTGFPTTLGSYQQTFPGNRSIGVNKYNPDGSALLWSTHLGSTTGIDKPISMIANSQRNLYVMGRSNGNNYPTLMGSFQTNHGGATDVIISQLSEDGTTLLASTYFGGSGQEGFMNGVANPPTLGFYDNQKGEIQLDLLENVIAIFSSSSSNLNITDQNVINLSLSNHDALAIRLNPSLTNLLNDKLIGGSKLELGNGIRVFPDSSIYIVGNTTSIDLSTTTGAHLTSLNENNDVNGFLVKLDKNFQVQNSTYIESTTDLNTLVGNRRIGAYFIDYNANLDPIVCGVDKNQTLSAVNGGYLQGGGLVYFSTYTNDLGNVLKRHVIGGPLNGNTRQISLGAFEYDQCENILFSSYGSTHLPTVNDTSSIVASSQNSLFFGIIAQDSLKFGTYYNGNHVDGGTSRFDHQGILYQAVCVPNHFTTTPGAAFDNSNFSGFDLKVLKYSLTEEPRYIYIDTVNLEYNHCIKDSKHLSISSNSSNFDEIIWTINGIDIDTGMVINHLFDSVGSYLISAEGFKYNSDCPVRSIDSVLINVYDLHPDFEADTLLCINTNGYFNNLTPIPSFLDSNSLTFTWDFGDGNTSSNLNPTHAYQASGYYDVSLEIQNSTSCVYKETKTLYINVFEIKNDFSSLNKICLSEITEFTSELFLPHFIQEDNIVYYWDFGDGNSSGEKNPIHTYQNTGNYDVSLTIKVGDCEYTELKPNHIEIYDFQANFTTSYDSLTFPFDEDLIANPLENDYDSIVWIIKGQVFSDLDELQFHLKTEFKNESVPVTLKLFKGACESTSTKEVILYNNESYWIPNAFTPNGDGINEQFIPEGRLIENSTIFRFAIYSRWGEQVFYSEDNTVGWFGVNKRGQLVKSDMYVWTLEVYSKVEGLIVDKGFVELIK